MYMHDTYISMYAYNSIPFIQPLFWLLPVQHNLTMSSRQRNAFSIIGHWWIQRSSVDSPHKGPPMPNSFNVLVVLEQTVDLPMISEIMTLIRHHCNAYPVCLPQYYAIHVDQVFEILDTSTAWTTFEVLHVWKHICNPQSEVVVCTGSYSGRCSRRGRYLWRPGHPTS